MVVGSWAALEALQSLDDGTKWEPTGTVVPGVEGTMVVAGGATVVGGVVVAEPAATG